LLIYNNSKLKEGRSVARCPKPRFPNT